MSMTTSEAAAWRKGVRSGVLKPLHDRCPYPGDTAESRAWASGRVEGQAHEDGHEVLMLVREIAVAAKAEAAKPGA